MKKVLMFLILFVGGSAWGADNIAITPGSGDTVAADDVGSAKHQRVKVEFGADGTATEVSPSNPLPATVSISGSSNTIQGTVTANAGSGVFNVSGSTMVVMAQNGGSLAVSLSGNQAVNVAQVAGATINTGNGTASGSQRTAIASDNSAFTINISTSIGSATPGVSLVCVSTFANVAASQTDSVLVGAIASTKLRVVSVVTVAGGTATNLTFNSKGGGAGAAISPLFANAANGGFVLPNNRMGWMESATAEALTVTTGSGSTTGILVYYCRL